MCGWQLFPTNARSGEVWAAAAYEKLSATGISPESQLDARAPGLLDLLQRRGHSHPPHLMNIYMDHTAAFTLF